MHRWDNSTLLAAGLAEDSHANNQQYNNNNITPSVTHWKVCSVEYEYNCSFHHCSEDKYLGLIQWLSAWCEYSCRARWDPGFSDPNIGTTTTGQLWGLIFHCQPGLRPWDTWNMADWQSLRLWKIKPIVRYHLGLCRLLLSSPPVSAGGRGEERRGNTGNGDEKDNFLQKYSEYK